MAMNRNVLYHGTRYARSILRSGVLFTAYPGKPKVAFTRSPEVAAYWALMERFNDEGRGAILVFDRESLHSRHKIDLIHEKWVEVGDAGWHDEAEEEIWEDVTDVAKHLMGLVYGPETSCSHKLKMRNRMFSMETDVRLEELLLPVPDWCRRSVELEENLNKEMRAINALSTGIGITEVARQLGLSVRKVRRLAGRLRQRDARDWSLAEIVLSWGLIDRAEHFQQIVTSLVEASGSNAVSSSCGVVKVGAERIDALMTYSGMSCDDVVNSLGQELPDLIGKLGLRTIAEKPEN
jgi:hypothetical protein